MTASDANDEDAYREYRRVYAQDPQLWWEHTRGALPGQLWNSLGPPAKPKALTLSDMEASMVRTALLARMATAPEGEYQALKVLYERLAP